MVCRETESVQPVLSVLHEEKHRIGSDSGVGTTKTCRTPSDIGAEQENHNVGRGPT